ncbi:hypothetical protein ACOM2C_09150 [Pseudarthrobacter sp. So.54]
MFHGGGQVLGPGLRGADPDGQAQAAAGEVSEAGGLRNDVLGEDAGAWREEVQGSRSVRADFQGYTESAAATVGRQLLLVGLPAWIGAHVSE